MAFLVVEDGTGLPEAQTFISEGDALQRAADEPGLFPGLLSSTTEEAVAPHLKAAFLWMSRDYKWKLNGRPTSEYQAGAFPRFGCWDDSGRFVRDDEIPDDVIFAQLTAAEQNAVAGDLASVGGGVVEVTIGGNEGTDLRMKSAASVEDYGSVGKRIAGRVLNSYRQWNR